MVRTGRLARLAPWAGPAAIVGAVLAVLHDFAFGGLLSTQHIDVLPQWLPTYCFLGKSLATGHVPAWNPYSLAGTPFAADPQSGWTYLPAMLLFSALSCGRAIRWFIVLQPILAGLGIYAFLRSELLSRPAATAGGLVLAMVMADSYLALSLPFAGTLAWTALLLAAASKFMRSASWEGRFGWAIAVAVAWGQLANAHMSHGLAMGTAALSVYLVVRSIGDLRAGRQGMEVLAAVGLLLVALPAVDLAVFWPRLAYVHRASLGLGYLKLQTTAAHLAHRQPLPFGVGASSPVTWPLGLTTSPGSYLGAVALGLTFAGWRARRHLGLVIGYALYGAACFVLSLHTVAQGARSTVMHTGPGQLWLHEPARFRYGTLLAMSVLVAFGVEAWREAKRPSERALLLVPGVVVFGVLPPLTHVTHDNSAFVLAMALLAIVVLAVTAWRPALLALIPALLVGELVANGFAGQGAGYTLSGVGIERPGRYIAWAPLREPNVDAAAYLHDTPIERALRERQGSRYLSLAFEGFRRERGYLLLQRPRYWGLLANERSMLFHLRDVQGYNPAQLLRFWSFVRAVDPKYIHYNAAFLTRDANPVAFDLLQVGWEVSSGAGGQALGLPAPVARDGGWALYRAPGSPPMASANSDWVVEPSPGRALAAVLRAGPIGLGRTVYLEQDPGIPRSSGGGGSTAVYRPTGSQSARIDVRARAPVVVLIRTPYDSEWRATLDDRPVPVLHADYVDMVVAVPRGAHSISLGYDDPRILYGLVGSGLSLVALVLASRVAARRRRRAPG